MIGYKRDDLTTDTICLEVFCDRKISFTITEDSDLGQEFSKRLLYTYPKIDEFSENRIVWFLFKVNEILS